jgi:[acyl-carrier-protein] S-malonyltransferase
VIRTAVLFPGQGSQYPGMGREFAESFPASAAVYATASEVLGYDVAALCFEESGDRLTLTEFAQPAILVTSLAAYAALEPLGMEPAFMAGHSLGEWSAVVAAGGLSLTDGVRLVGIRGRLMGEACPGGSGGMAAVLGLPSDVVESACRTAGGTVQVANLNSPGQVVISGRREDVERAGEEARRVGAKKVVPLAVSGPFHSALMTPAAERFAAELARFTLRDLRVPVVANADARPHGEADEVRGLLVRQISSPVRWEESMRFLAADGVTVVVEAGPKSVLAGLMKRIDPGVRAFSTDRVSDLAAIRGFLTSGGTA